MRRGGGGGLNDFKVVTFIGHFPSDGVTTMAVKVLIQKAYEKHQECSFKISFIISTHVITNQDTLSSDKTNPTLLKLSVLLLSRIRKNTNMTTTCTNTPHNDVMT